MSTDEPPIAVRLLDAAAAVVARYGLRRTTMDDIARAAGCSRQTLYKHHPSRESLFASLFVRETDLYMQALEALLDSLEPLRDEHLVDAFVFTMQYVRKNALIQGVIAAEDNGIVSVLSLGEGAILALVHERITAALVRFVTAGAIAPVEPAILGETFVRTAASFFVLPPLGVDLDDEAGLRAYGRRVFLGR